MKIRKNDKVSKKNPYNEKPITLAPLDERDALKALLDTPPMPKRKRGRNKSNHAKK